MEKIPPTEKNKILKEENDVDDYYDEDDDFEDRISQQEKEEEYLEQTVIELQRKMMEYVERKSLTICEYVTTEKIKEYLSLYY